MTSRMAFGTTNPTGADEPTYRRMSASALSENRRHLAVNDPGSPGAGSGPWAVPSHRPNGTPSENHPNPPPFAGHARGLYRARRLARRGDLCGRRAPDEQRRRQPAAGALLSLSGADPLNLVGILTPGPRLPALTGNRLLYRDGLPIALLAAGEVQFLETLDPPNEWEAHKALLRCAEPAGASDARLHGRKGIVFHHGPARPS